MSGAFIGGGAGGGGGGATDFSTDSGTAVQVGGILSIVGAGTVSTSGAGNVVTVTGSGTTTFTCDSGSATVAANTVSIVGSGGATTSGSGSTITVTAGGGGGTTFNGDSGTASGATVTLAGGTGITTVGDGASTVTFNLDTPVTVDNGGTGLATATAYAVLCGGTTGTGAFQSIASVGTSGQVLTSNGAGALPTFQAAAGGTPPPREFFFGAESLQPLETNFAPLEKLSGTNVKTFVRAFDDTTEEFANGKIQIPGDVSTTGSDTVTFRAYVMAKTAAANKNVKLTFGHLPVNDSEDFDQAYTDKSVDDQAIDATQDDLSEITWTETLTNLGWAANDLVYFRFSREAATTNNLAGDMYLHSFCIEVPRE